MAVALNRMRLVKKAEFFDKLLDLRVRVGIQGDGALLQ
jgi:hypothetical protein